MVDYGKSAVGPSFLPTFLPTFKTTRSLSIQSYRLNDNDDFRHFAKKKQWQDLVCVEDFGGKTNAALQTESTKHYKCMTLLQSFISKWLTVCCSHSSLTLKPERLIQKEREREHQIIPAAPRPDATHRVVLLSPARLCSNIHARSHILASRQALAGEATRGKEEGEGKKKISWPNLTNTLSPF